jgi:phosphopantetheinyl transferase
MSRECAHCGHPHHGKPRLTGAGADFEFSASRSGSVVAVAVTVGRMIGLDIECAKPEEAGALVEWTRKEAVLKCIGVGLALDPRQLIVSAVNESPAIVCLPPPYGLPDQFDLRPICVRDDVIGHLAVFEGQLDIVLGNGASLL